MHRPNCLLSFVSDTPIFYLSVSKIVSPTPGLVLSGCLIIPADSVSDTSLRSEQGIFVCTNRLDHILTLIVFKPPRIMQFVMFHYHMSA